MATPVVIFGAGDIAQLVYYYFVREGGFDVAAFTVDAAYLDSDRLEGLPVVPFETVHTQFPPDDYDMFIALSYSQVNTLRAEKYTRAKEKGYSLVTYVSPDAVVAENCELGDNCFVFEHNTIQPFARIGNDVIIWSGNHIGHHATIKDHCFVSSHVVVAGGATIEPFCFLGINATIRDHVTIAQSCVVGAGAIILKDTEEKQVFATSGTAASRIPSDRLRKI